MGGATSKEEQDIALKAATVPSGKPYFFLASCPEDSRRAAKALADKYGGFHCLDGDEGFDAWKGRAAGQFSTLKRLSPSGRKVIGIAIAGFGHCNDEREFLRQLGGKRGHEQFELKQCGDVKDMERWLQSEGYGSDLVSQGTACPSPEESGRTQAVATDAGRAALWASVTSFFGSKAAAPGAWKERWLMDLQRALAEAEAVDESPEALRGASAALTTALENARGAGVPEADLEATGAEKRREQLGQLLRAAERKQSCCGCWCCCTEARGLRQTQQQETQVVFSTGGLDTKVLETSQTTKLETSQGTAAQGQGQGQGQGSPKLSSKARGLEEERRDLSMKTVLPFQAHRDPWPLPLGTKCRYHSPRNGWLVAVVEGFNANDGTCNLDIKKHAKPENIFPAANVPKAQAWPPGTLVEYESSSAGHWLEATIVSFNEGTGKVDSSYNLDVRQAALVDRIRLRVL